MMFCSVSLWSCIVQSGQKKRKSCDISELFPFLLPSDCSVNITVTDGVVATYDDNHTKEYDEHQLVATMLLLGPWPGCEVVHWSCDHSDSERLAKHLTGAPSRGLPQALQKLTKKEVKMINLFCSMSGINPDIGHALYKVFDWPLIAGGYVNEKYLKAGNGEFNRYTSDIKMSGVAICGEKVKVSSVLIKDEVETEEEVQELIKELADHNLPLEHSFGLMYACVGRGIHIYDGMHNVESKVFKQHFPNTPLFGFFGNGEIGCNFPPINQLKKISKRKRRPSQEEQSDYEQQRKDREYLMKHPPKLLHAYTTVMCLVSLPNPARR